MGHTMGAPSFPIAIETELSRYPDHRQIACFFLGAVFITGLNYSFQWILGFFPRVTGWVFHKRSPTNDPENEKASITSSLSNVRLGDNSSLVFILSLCFVFASIASFGSLLSFNGPGGFSNNNLDQSEMATCAFFVAWGGVTTQAATLVGILTLLLELKGLGIPNEEFYSSLGFLFVEMVLVFVDNAVGTGSIQSLSWGSNVVDTVCFRNHSIPTALAVSLMSLFLELYVLLRFAALLMRRTTWVSQRLAALCDRRIGKILSLLLLEFLTIGPSAVFINILAEFIPLSIGAIIVLWVFNTYKTVREDNDTFQEDEDIPVPIPRTTPPFTGPGDMRPSWTSANYKFVQEDVDFSMPPRSAPAPPAGLNPVRPSWRITGYKSAREDEAPNPSTASPYTAPAPVQPSIWFSPAFGLSQSTGEADGTPPALPAAAVHSSTDRYQVSSRFSMSTDERTIQTVRRSTSRETVTSTARSVQRKPSPHNPFVNVESPRSINVAGAQVTDSSGTATPTSILMHPWHEKNDKQKRRYNTDASESVDSTIKPKGGDRLSYTVQGLSFPVPPTSSPIGGTGTRRYSSSTLASPAFSQGGGVGEGQKVHLLTFASIFRNSQS